MPEITGSKYTVNAGWDDVPHLDEGTKRELMAGTPVHLRDARARGIPGLGAGAIYPIAWEEVSCAPFMIPAYWKKGYALDVGWRRTAALWGAQDPADGTIYAISEYYAGEQLPVVHAQAIKSRGTWIRGCIDPAAHGRSSRDGAQLAEEYMSPDCGLRLVSAVNSVEAGLYKVLSLLQTRRLQLFSSLTNTAAEYRLYRRDDKGSVVKSNDHLMDCLRYLVMTWDQIAATRPVARDEEPVFRPLSERAGY